MRYAFETVFVNQSASRLDELKISPAVSMLWRSRWKGSLEAASTPIVIDKDCLGGSHLQALIDADEELRLMKTGGSDAAPSAKAVTGQLALFVVAYSRFSQAFYTDHGAAWAAWNRLLKAAIQLRLMAAIHMTVFLAGHLLVIAGWRNVGFYLARKAFQRAVHALDRKVPQNQFFYNIVLAAFPFTTFIAMRKSSEADYFLPNAERLLPADPYYRTIFYNGSLCFYAFRGDIIRSELLAGKLLAEQAKATLPRYQTFADIMVLLPLAMAGHLHLTRDRLQAILSRADTCTDARIRSEYLRAAAVISVYQGERSRALELIEHAREVGKNTEFAKVWQCIDVSVTECARGAATLTERSALFKKSRAPALYLPALGPLLIDLLHTMGQADDNDLVFCDQVVSAVSDCIRCGKISVVQNIPSALTTAPAIPFSGQFLLFSEVPKEYVGVVRTQIEALCPILKSVEILHRKLIASRNASSASGADFVAKQVAHDIRSPLAALELLISLTDKLDENERILLRGAAGRIRDIANTLLAPKPDAGSGLTDELTQPSLAAALVEAVCSEKRVEYARRSGVKITMPSLEEGYGAFVAANQVEIRRILSNLVTNSIEAIAEAGAVQLGLSHEKAQVTFEVTDNGKGIPEKFLARIGERGATQGKPGGNGLGLYHAKEFAERSGGHVSVHSEVQRGTTIKVTLPAATPPSWFLPTLSIAPRTCVVVLDDDPPIHQIWKLRFAAFSIHDVELIHFNEQATFISFVKELKKMSPALMVLADYELRDSMGTGLDALVDAGVITDSVLVTSHFEEQAVQRRCIDLGLRLLPKSMAGFVPMELASAD